MRFLFGDAFFYMLYFQEPGVADANLAADPERTMRGMLAGLSMDNMAGDSDVDPGAMFAADDRGFVERLPKPEKLPAWLSQDELDHYVAEFTRTGFTGGINWYRNLDRNWERLAGTEGDKVQPPAAFLGGAQDPVLMMTPPSVADGWLADDRGSLIVEGAGHWVQQEKPDEVNAFVLQFLAGLPPGW
jgi:pimeloyl-ACP methyl ester carboxylesterase